MRRTWMAAALVLSLLGPAAALASNGRGNDRGGGHGGNPHRPPGGGGQYGAPEPLTLIGLGVGAGAIGLAKWRSNRKKQG